MTTRKALSPEAMAEKEKARKAMREAAKDMGISVTEFAEMIEYEKALVEMDAAPRRRNDGARDEEGHLAVSEKAAELLPIHPEGKARKAMKAARKAARKDAAVIASRKIIRALPLTADAVVSTRIGWEIVTISRVENAPAVAPIRRRLKAAEAAEAEALEAREAAEAAAARKTVLKRTPKAEAEAVSRAAAVADKKALKVRKLRKALKAAEAARVAGKKTSVRVGDVRVQLNPQSMANRVAKIARKIPTRKDVMPIRDTLKMRHGARVPFGFISHPEAEYLRYVAMVEAEAARAAAIEKAEARKAEIVAAMVAAAYAESEALVAAREATASAYKARRAMAARERRRNAKLRRH